MSSTGGYYLESQNHVEDIFLVGDGWGALAELEGFVGHLAEQEGGSPHRSAGKRQARQRGFPAWTWLQRT